MEKFAALACLLLAAATTAIAADKLPDKFPWPDDPPRGPAYARTAAIAETGRKIFFDPSLSGSGQLSCASCHDPARAFSAPDAQPVRLGGPGLNRAGIRAVPNLTYLAGVPPFQEHFHESEDDGDESTDAGPTGGLTWDGRVDRLRDQAHIPLFNPDEMANDTPAALASRIRNTPYAGNLRATLGADAWTSDASVIQAAVTALETYLQQPAAFSPYSSKYDAVLRGEASLTETEARGLDVFNDPARGNCIACHKSLPNASGAPPLFGDFGMNALGLPRNNSIPANANPDHFDLGLCGPERTDLKDRPEFCGMFRTPTLRNVALKASYFHNGVVHSLREAVAFYAERDLKPWKWYPRNPDGSIRMYDDLPERYQGNIDREPPFDRKPGDPPALTDREIDDVVAFLQTLTDGYKPKPGTN